MRLLAEAGISSPRLEARMIFAFILQSEEELITPFSEITPAQETDLRKIIKRRLNHEPLDKILGYRDFYKYRFKVNDEVLSPRPDSEILVEAAIKRAKNFSSPKILELGVGSGCLILSVLGDVVNAQGVGIDKSPQALKIARHNTSVLQMENRLELKQWDYFLPPFTNEKFSLIISNPPYIPSDDIQSLQKEVKDFDPVIALDGGQDGCDHYRRIAEIIPQMIEKGGYLLLEIGINQASKVCEIFIRQGFVLEETIRDLAGIERCLVLKMN
ncbi:MAG: peptide chain release factor N(5)-glutamine methyltransferase [Alphaproteobacteria bacterium]|nr:peptide chain release factor N(5)-glutamine methyltransferase [Alphaproteobacteria bacterium]